MVGRMPTITVAPVSSTIHGIATELLVGPTNGLEQVSAVKCDQIVTVPFDRLYEQCGWLLQDQERALHEAIQAAFDLV